MIITERVLVKMRKRDIHRQESNETKEKQHTKTKTQTGKENY